MTTSGFSVRIDKARRETGGYIFNVEPCDVVFEMVALDSAPGIIAMVHAESPGHACQLAWERGAHMNDPTHRQLSGDQDILDKLMTKP